MDRAYELQWFLLLLHVFINKVTYIGNSYMVAFLPKMCGAEA